MNLLQDLRYGFRVLRKSPGFTFVAILSLALGIGANSAIFSVVNAVLLRPLPYPRPGELVRLTSNSTAVTMPELEYVRDHATSFSSVSGERGTSDRRLGFGATQQWIKVMPVSADFFRTLGVVPALGREFGAGETRAGGPQAVVLTDGTWRRALGGDRSAIGRTITLDDASYTVVGVLPPWFWFEESTDGFVPLRPTGSIGDRGFNTEMLARLKPGVPPRQAQAEMAAIAPGIKSANPDLFKGVYHGLTVTPYREALAGDVRLNLLLLFGATALLLLIACSNLASLLLARLAVRRKEIAMRIALGSGRGRLLRQFLFENLILTLAGGVVGLMAARTILTLLVSIVPFDLPSAQPIGLDAPVVAFTLAVALFTGLAFSFAPILTASRLELYEALKAGGRSTGGARQRTRSVLVVSEVALAVTLLVSAGLLTESLYRLHQERLGFTTQGITTFTTPFARERRRSAADQRQYMAALAERFQNLPGVTALAEADVLPLGGFANFPVERAGHPENSLGAMEIRYVSPGYFATLGIPLRAGRAFRDSDTPSAAPVLLVNETLARRWWPGGNPVGDRVVLGRFQGKDYGNPTPREIAGVVGDTKTSRLQEPPKPTIYLSLAQSQDVTGSITWILRGRFSSTFAAELRRAVDSVDSRQRIGRIQTMQEIVESTTARSRFDAWLFASLAGLALALTAIGVYGLLSFAVARRTQEIGTRMALGASRGSVLALILKQGLVLIGVGLAVGLAGAFVATRSLATLLYGVKAGDPLSFAGVSVLLLAVGALASYFPARRATKVDPMVALREE